jgi:hypothetical protein
MVALVLVSSKYFVLAATNSECLLISPVSGLKYTRGISNFVKLGNSPEITSIL